ARWSPQERGALGRGHARGRRGRRAPRPRAPRWARPGGLPVLAGADPGPPGRRTSGRPRRARRERHHRRSRLGRRRARQPARAGRTRAARGDALHVPVPQHPPRLLSPRLLAGVGEAASGLEPRLYARPRPRSHRDRRPRAPAACRYRSARTTTADVVIVGAGTTGLSIAFSLAAAGTRNVLVLERRFIGAGGTGRS